jgi:hypothetical protein
MYFLSGDIVELIPGNDAHEDSYFYAPQKALYVCISYITSLE